MTDQRSATVIPAVSNRAVRWLSDGRLLVPKPLLAFDPKAVALQDAILMVQKTSSGQRCIYGLFRLGKELPDAVVLKGEQVSRQSRLRAWALAQGEAVSWSAELLRQLQSAPSTSSQIWQSCRTWILNKHNGSVIEIASRASRHFFRSSEFSEIVAIKPTPLIRIRADVINKGWWIEGITQSHEFLARSALNGIEQRIRIKFSPNSTHKRAEFESLPRKQLKLVKPFALPGWD
ncbi:hypothetical protein EBU99_09330 [bacterium]|nr:hypothetical protein [bacterium]